MKTIIAGSRNIHNYVVVCKAVEQSDFEITEVVSGGCDGVDKLGERWATEHGIPTTGSRFYVSREEWKKVGPSAGPKRNQRMAEYAEALIAVPGPDSKGTKGMINKARKANLKVYIHE